VWTLAQMATGRAVASLARERHVSEGAVWQVRSRAVMRMRRHLDDPEPDPLTPRQRELLELRDQGYTSRGGWRPNTFRFCGSVLGISHQAAKKHYDRARANLAAAQQRRGEPPAEEPPTRLAA
jgi:hypothetical protein